MKLNKKNYLKSLCPHFLLYPVGFDDSSHVEFAHVDVDVGAVVETLGKASGRGDAVHWTSKT